MTTRTALSRAAAAMGRLAKGRPKTLSPIERERRRRQMIEINKARAARKEQQQ